MLHKLTGVTIGVTLILMLLTKFDVHGGPIVTLGAVALLLASCVLTAVTFVMGRRAQKPVPAAATKKPLGDPGDSPMKVACLYLNAGDALRDQGKVAEAIATYREGVSLVEKDLGPQHFMVFSLRRTAERLEEAQAQAARGVRK